MKSILLIEDDQFIRDLVSTKLTESQFKIIVALSAEEAIESLKTTMPELIVLDLELPSMQGTDLLKKLKSDVETKDIPVIVFSNNDEPEAMEECKKLGALEFYVKINTDLNVLVSKVTEVLN